WRRVRDLAGRLGLPVAVTLLLLALTTTAGPWLTAVAVAAAATAGRLVGPVLGRHPLVGWRGLGLIAALLAVPAVVFVYVAGPAGVDDWGGFMMNLFLAGCSIGLSFPLGVALALGRRSTLP